MNFIEKKQFEEAKKYIKSGMFVEANNVINQMILESGDNPEVMSNVGKLYIVMGRYNLASVYIRRSFDLEKSFETLELLANVNYEAGKYDLSAVEYEELIKHEPREDFYEKCIASYEKLDFYEEAIRVARMYNFAVETPSSYAQLIFMYITAGMEDMAIFTCEDMQKKFPNHILTFNVLGLLHECIYNDYDKAKEYFKKASNQGYIDAYYNLGVCCKQSEDLENAEIYLKRLLSLKTNIKSDCYYTLGSVYMAGRKLRKGYKYYLKRRIAVEKKERYKKFLWDGKDYPNDILYVSDEQGFGDNIQFIRYLPLVAEKFKKVIYGVREPLVQLFKQSFPQEKYSNIEIVTEDNIVKFNKFVLIMDLPYYLHMNFHNIPAKKSYLVANERKTDMMKTNYFNNNNFKLGLCWRSKGMQLRDAIYRTIDAPYYFKPFMDMENTSYYSFQMGDIFNMCEKYPQIKDLSPEFTDFSDTAAALKNLDVLITVDTALAHLAGALGVKTYLLLCHAPDWRWFDNTEKTEWYPSVTIIKQHDRRTWEDVSAKLNEYIQNDVKEFNKKRLKNKSLEE